MQAKSVGWSLGNYCNAKCPHCYSEPVRYSGRFFKKKEIALIIRKLANMGVESVNFGGNEPIFTNGPNPNKSLLPYAIEKITDFGMKVCITTNGTTSNYLHKSLSRTFSLINEWDFSLDSPFPAEHNSHRRLDSFHLVIQGLEWCAQLGVSKTIAVCAMRWNFDVKHLTHTLKLAKAHKAEIRINTLKPTKPYHYDMIPTVEQYFRCFNFLVKKTSHVGISDPILCALCGTEIRGCVCGSSSLRIHAKTEMGTVPVSPCTYIHSFRTGDVLKDDLPTIIANSSHFMLLRRRVSLIPDKCKALNCKYIHICRGGCAARALLINRDINSPDPYCPQLALLKGFGLPKFPQLKTHSLGTRTHENYLCTWIGRPA